MVKTRLRQYQCTCIGIDVYVDSFVLQRRISQAPYGFNIHSFLHSFIMEIIYLYVYRDERQIFYLSLASFCWDFLACRTLFFLFVRTFQHFFKSPFKFVVNLLEGARQTFVVLGYFLLIAHLYQGCANLRTLVNIRFGSPTFYTLY